MLALPRSKQSRLLPLLDQAQIQVMCHNQLSSSVAALAEGLLCVAQS